MALELADDDGLSRESPEAGEMVLSLLFQAGFKVECIQGTRHGVKHCWCELAYPDRPFEYILDLSAPDFAGPVVLFKGSLKANVYQGRTLE